MPLVPVDWLFLCWLHWCRSGMTPSGRPTMGPWDLNNRLVEPGRDDLFDVLPRVESLGCFPRTWIIGWLDDEKLAISSFFLGNLQHLQWKQLKKNNFCKIFHGILIGISYVIKATIIWIFGCIWLRQGYHFCPTNQQMEIEFWGISIRWGLNTKQSILQTIHSVCSFLLPDWVILILIWWYVFGIYI